MSSKLKELEIDPEFQKLAFPEQAQLRAIVFSDVLSKDPDARGITQEEFVRIVQEYSLQPPSFKNPKVQAFAQAIKNTYQNNPSFWVSFLEGFTESSLPARGALYLGKAVEKFLNIPGQPVETAYEALYGEDSDKLRDWLRYTSGSNPLGAFLGNMGRVATDLMILRALPLSGKLFGGMKSTVDKIASGTKLRSQILNGVLWKFAENTVEDIFLTGMELTNKAIQGKDVLNLHTIASTYAENAIYDYILGTAIAVGVPLAKIMGKSLRASFVPDLKRTDVPKELVNVPIEDVLKSAVSGELSEGMVQRVPEYFNDTARYLKVIQDSQAATKKNIAALEQNPYYRLMVTGRALGFEPGISAEGKIVLRSLKDISNNVDVPRGYTSVVEAQEHVFRKAAELIAENPKAFSPEMYGLDAPAIQTLTDIKASLDSFTPPKDISFWNRGHIFKVSADAATHTPDIKLYRTVGTDSVTGLPIYEATPDGNILGIFKKLAGKEDVARATMTAEGIVTRSLGDSVTLKDLTMDILRREGFYGIDLGEGKVVSLYSSAAIPIAEKLSKAPSNLRVRSAPETTDAYVKITTEKLLSEEQLRADPKAVSGLFLQPKLTEDGLRNFVDSATEPVKATGYRVQVELTKEGLEGNSYRISVDPEGKDIQVMADLDKLQNYGERKKFISELKKKAIKETLEDVPFNVRVLYRKTFKPLKVLEIPGKTFQDKVAFMQENYKKFFNRKLEELPDGKYLDQATGIRYESLEEAGRDLLIKSLDGDTLRAVLAQNGLKVKKDGNVVKIVTSEGEEIGRGTSIKTALIDSGFVPDKFPSTFLPEVVLVEPGRYQMQVSQFVTAGSYTDVIMYLRKFMAAQRYAQETLVHQTPVAFQYQLPNRLFEVHLPKAGVIERFREPQEAIRFMRGGWAQAEGIRRVLDRRGLPFSIENGKYVTYVDGKQVTASIGNKEEIKKLFSALPDPEASPALLGEEVEQLLLKNGHYMPPMGPLRDPFLPPDFKERIGPFEVASRLYPTPQAKWLQEKLTKTGHEEMAKTFQKLLNQYTVYNAEVTKQRLIFKKLFAGPDGKIIPKGKREGIRWYLDAKTDQIKEAIKKEFNLDPQDIEIAERVRDYFGRNPGDGMFALLGVDPHKFLYDYVPRIRKSVEELAAMKVELTPQNIFAKSFPNGIPHEIKFFAENARVEELLSFAAETDMAVILDRYVVQGLKKKYLNPIWRDLDSQRRRAAKARALDPEIGIALDQFRETLMGFKTTGEKSLELFSSRLFERLGLGDTILAKDFARVLMTLNSFVGMAWKPWSVVRNILQIYTTFAAPYGVTVANKALRKVAKNPDEYIAKARALGIIIDTPPLIHAIIDEQLQEGRIVHKGLAAYTTSDALTRSIAMVGASDLFEEGLQKFRKGVLKTQKELLEYLKAYRFPETEQVELAELIRTGKLGGAKDSYIKAVVKDSMFAYDRIHNPNLYRGLAGRLFGQFGVYPVQYIQNLRAGLTKGPLTDRLGYASRLVAASTAFLATANQLGIDAQRDFTVWGPALFTGGPVFNLVLDMYRSTGQGYEADLARKRLEYAIPNMIPGVSIGRTLSEAYQHIDQGNGWLAWLRLTSAPLKEELRL